MDVEDGIPVATECIPIAQEILKEKGPNLTARDNAFVRTWVELTDKDYPWIDEVLRATLAALLHPTVCEGNFSVVSHILAPRRLRMGRVMLAAAMFSETMPQYMHEAPEIPRVTSAGTMPIEKFMARKGQLRVALSSRTTSSMGSSRAQAVRVEEEETTATSPTCTTSE